MAYFLKLYVILHAEICNQSGLVRVVILQFQRLNFWLGYCSQIYHELVEYSLAENFQIIKKNHPVHPGASSKWPQIARLFNEFASRCINAQNYTPLKRQ